MHHGLTIAALVFLLAFNKADGSDETLERSLNYLRENRVSIDTPQPHKKFAQIRRQIAATPDPGTDFGYVIFSVARHSDKLLSAVQTAQVEALIESRQNAVINWHDVRNIIRVHAVTAMWDYAQAGENVAQYRKNWDTWNELLLAYMFEEFIAAEQFQRAFWTILTVNQQNNLLSGEWDSYLKKSTGHKRLFSADKQVQRVLGKPDNPGASNQVNEHWSQLWQPMHQRYLAASKFQRQREFAMDLTDENFSVAAWDEYAAAFRAFVTMECDAVREILQASYDLDAAASAQLDQNRDHLHADMIEKYRPKYSDFLRAIGAIRPD